MNTLFGRLCVITILFAGTVFPSDTFAAKYSGRNPVAQFAAEKPAVKKALPPGASVLPDKDLKAGAPITFDELRMFVRDWRKYTRWLKTSGNEYKAVAYLGVSGSGDYPPEVVKWMDEHGWTVDRFFLLERKFRMTLSVQKQEARQNLLRSHVEGQIRQLDQNSSLSIDQKKAMKNQYQKTISSIRSQISGKAPVTPEEYELIKLNHDALAKVLDE